MTALAALRRLMHTSTVGGESLTEDTAEQVTPARPCGPSVATTVTAVTAFDKASLNAVALTLWATLSRSSACDTICLLRVDRIRCACDAWSLRTRLDSCAPNHQQRTGMETI